MENISNFWITIFWCSIQYFIEIDQKWLRYSGWKHTWIHGHVGLIEFRIITLPNINTFQWNQSYLICYVLFIDTLIWYIPELLNFPYYVAVTPSNAQNFSSPFHSMLIYRFWILGPVLVGNWAWPPHRNQTVGSPNYCL